MPKPFDATTKFLVELNPTDWLHLLGLPVGPTRITETDLSTVSTAADRLVIVAANPPYALLVEFQGNTDPEFESRLLEYAVLAKNRLKMPIYCVVVLLRSFAGHAALKGRYVMRGPDDELLLDFRYRALRVWRMPPEVFLAGGLAVLPLATIANTRRSELVRILDRIEERLETEATPARADLLRTATFVLMGIKFDKILVEKLMSRNVLELSSTYQALHQEAKAEGHAEGHAEGRMEGRMEEARRFILRIGTRRFGVPTAEIIAWLETITDPESLEVLLDSLLTVESWKELELNYA